MKQLSLPAFSEISDVLDKTTLKLHASQVHGLISGLLCGHLDASHPIAWEEIVTGEKKGKKVAPELQLLHDATNKQLEEFLFEFQLVLPEETEHLSVRAEALTVWCQGFLTGLKHAQVQIIDREPSEVTEAINDLVEIAKMNYEEVVPSEEDEGAYTELVEYVRMAAILIYQDLHEAKVSHEAVKNSNYLH